MDPRKLGAAQRAVAVSIFLLTVFSILVATVVGLLWGVPQYWLYKARLNGEAVIITATAQAQAASIIAQSDAATARTVGASLNGNDAYLRFRWLVGLNNNKGDTVYVPTEAGMPVLASPKIAK